MKLKIYQFFGRISKPFGRDSIILLLRVWLGVMMVYHGSDKLFRSFEALTIHLTTFGIPLSGFISAFVVFSQFLGGALIFMGLLTRPALLCVFITILLSVIEALFFLQYDPFARKAELALVYLVLSFALLMFGPGRYSIDSQIGKQQKTGFEPLHPEEIHHNPVL